MFHKTEFAEHSWKNKLLAEKLFILIRRTIDLILQTNLENVRWYSTRRISVSFNKPNQENIRLGSNQTEEYEVYLNNPVQRLSGSFI